MMSSSSKKILQPVIYHRDDDGPIKSLEQIYPFYEVNPINQYDYEAVFCYVSPFGFKEIIPIMLKWICNTELSTSGYPVGLSSNLMDQFVYCINDTSFWNRIVISGLKLMDTEEKRSLAGLMLPILSLEVLELKDRMLIEKLVDAFQNDGS